METTSPRDAQRLLAERPFDLLVVDNVMPQLSGLDLIREYVAGPPEGERAQILMRTAHATVESAIEAMKLGRKISAAKPDTIKLSCDPAWVVITNVPITMVTTEAMVTAATRF